MAPPRQARRTTEERTATDRRKPGLEVHEDLDFQRRDWLAQRVGWVVIAAMLLAALAGLMGPGPLSHTTRGDGRYLTVEYDRFVRHGARTAVTFRIAPQAAGDGRVRIAIDRRFLVANDLQRLVPDPGATRGRNDTVEFIYDVVPGVALLVRWTVEPDRLGSRSSSVRLNDGPAVEIAQFTYP